MITSLWGAIVNTAAILAGGLLGLLSRRGLSERFSAAVMKGLALCVLLIGLTGTVKGQNTLVIIVSMLVGALIGEALDIDRAVTRLGERLQARAGRHGGDVTEGFVNATLLFCVGAMAVLGPLESGLKHVHTTQYAKALLDCISAMIYASTMGAGVLLSAVPVLVYQGTITLLAQWVSPFLGETVVVEMTAVGSLLLVALSLNLLGLTKLKVMNYIPAIFMPILLLPIYDWVAARL